ncbi:MAG TPA: endo-1,4-beta-xylanase [Blastocatellia bacterium]|nr:endo-1,4-beta-xylanase [Blastocatellia bacterium]
MRVRIIIFVLCSIGLFALPNITRTGAQNPTLRSGADQRGFLIGAAVAMSPFRNEPIYQDTLRREFNTIVAENAFKWDAVHPARTTFNFTDTDALVNFATANNMAIRGHTLVWHNQIPSWLVNGNFTRDEVIAILREHILTLVGRYRGVVMAWDVVNEAFEESGALRNSFWFQKIGSDYIRMAFQFAREADPNAKLYYNDFNTEGMNSKSTAAFNLIRDLRAQGVPIDGVGFQMHLINPFRVQQQHRDNFSRFASLGLELSITELDIRIALPTTTDKLQQQALGYSDVIQLCLSQPNCRVLTTWGFTDKFSWVPGTFSGQGDALIFDVNYQPKPAYFALLDALQGTQQSQPPPAPTGLNAVAGNGQVSLSWNAAPNATSYNVKRSTVSGGPYTVIAGVTTTSFTNTALANGTTFFYVVSALNANGESVNSAQVSATPRAPTPPPAPTGLVATAGNGQVALTWNASSGATSYNVKRATTSGGPYTTIASNVSTTSFTNSGLANGTTFFYVVSAVNAAGESGNSSQVSATPSQGTAGSMTVAATVSSSSNPWWSELDVTLSHTVSLTALTVTVTVQKTAGVTGSGQYSNFPGGALLISRAENASTIVYTFQLAAGQTLAAGTNRICGSQFSGNGTPHSYTGDTYVVTFTPAGGTSQTISGHF